MAGVINWALSLARPFGPAVVRLLYSETAVVIIGPRCMSFFADDGCCRSRRPLSRHKSRARGCGRDAWGFGLEGVSGA